MTVTAHHVSSLRRGRIAASLMFLLSGAAFGTWTARIPSIKHSLQLSDGQLSIALLALAAGGLIGMQLVGRLVDRYGSTTVMTPVAVALGTMLIPPAYAYSHLTLSVALFAFGAVHGTLNVAMNAHAVECERVHQRSIMSSFHAMFSVGGLLGAATGGAFAHARLSPAATFIIVGAVTTVLALWAVRWALTSPARDADDAPATDDGPTARRASTKQRPTARVFLLGLLAFCSLVGEGAAADWSSVYLHDSLGASTAIAATAYAAFSITMTAGRLAGDRLVAAFGPARLVRGCGLVAAAGLTAGVLIDHPAAAIAGFACLGAGLSCIIPQVFSAAGNLNPEQAGRDLARVAAIGYLGFLLGPAIIGAAAGLLGLPHALLVLPLLTLLVAVAAGAVRSPRLAARS